MIVQTFHRRLAGLAGLAVASLAPFACGGPHNDSSNVGVPCTPGDERDPRFAGFRVTQDVLETGAPECGGGVCLANHFQGAVSCPLGQPAPRDAQGLEGCVPAVDASGHPTVGQGSCSPGYDCVPAGSRSAACDPSKGEEANKTCAALGAGGKCGSGGTCECITDADCAFLDDASVSCDGATHQCTAHACHKPGDCQDPSLGPEDNAGKACCVPGTDTPIVTAICGQCRGQAGHATRDAVDAVYCTCRCGVADGAPDEPDYPFCSCPQGFECSEIRSNIGLGDPTLTGKYCILSGTAYETAKNQCGLVDGHWNSDACAGISSGECKTSTGSCIPN